MINYGQTVPKDAVRIEEMINYFPYNYPQPTDQHPFSISTEYSIAPWNPKHKLLKIGLQGKNLDLGKAPKSNLVFCGCFRLNGSGKQITSVKIISSHDRKAYSEDK
jgi:Ca-activated chloride channel family protein